MKSCHIEKEVLEQMHYFLSIPRLFHIHMACIDAINHIYASVQSCSDPNGLYKKLTLLNPNDTAKLNKKVPPFCMMNVMIHATYWGSDTKSSTVTNSGPKYFVYCFFLTYPHNNYIFI